MISRRDLFQYFSVLGLSLIGKKPTVETVIDLDDHNKNTGQITMQLDWQYNVQFAGLLLADYYKLYQQHGLKVEIKPWESEINLFKAVTENPLTLGCAEQDAILTAQIQGYPVKAIATMFQASPMGLMSLPEKNIQTLYDLVGQKVGMHGDTKKVMEWVMNSSGLSPEDIELVPVSFTEKYDRLQSGELAAVQCYVVDEPIGFTYKTQIKPTILKFSDYGYEPYVQVIFANKLLLEKDSQRVNQFLKASFQGWKLALNDIKNSAKIVVENYIKPDSKYHHLEYQTQSLQLIADYIQLEGNPDKMGLISPQRWQTMSEKLAQYGMIESVPDLSDSLDSQLWSIA